MVHALALWAFIGDATMYTDKSPQSLNLGLRGVQGRIGVCCVCWQCAHVQSSTRHWELFHFITFQAWPMWGAAKEGWPRNPPQDDMLVHR